LSETKPEEAELVRLILEYIDGRKSAKVTAAEDERRKGKLDDEALAKKLSDIDATYEPRAWIESAARRSAQIRVATHVAKAVHPDSAASSLRAAPATSAQWTGTPPSARATDVVGNAAAMDVNGFLSLSHGGRTVGERLMGNDPAIFDVLRRLNVDPTVAREAMSPTFAPPDPRADQWLKQIYFPLGAEEHHLLAPLYPSSLIHEVHSAVSEARFGEEAKEARKARREGSFVPGGLVEYPDLVIEMFGSGKPQNVSVLTNKRRGEAYHLPSCPPVWDTDRARPLWGTRTVFHRAYPRLVRNDLKTLSGFLERERRNNVDLRDHRASLVGRLVDALSWLAMAMHALDPGWTADERCELDDAERLWLDPGRADVDEEFAAARAQGRWLREVADRFARWLNKELSRAGLPVGDAEHREWRDDVLDALGSDLEMEAVDGDVR